MTQEFQETVRMARSLVDAADKLEAKTKKAEQYRIAAAKYKAYFFHKTDLAEKLEKQSRENLDAMVGEFDGVTYASWRARAVYRTLDDMFDSQIITLEEYTFCNGL